MYSGSDSTESQKHAQWALNPTNYQNMANDQVDWAALAQQWIIMKEAGPPPIPGEIQVQKNILPPLKNETEEGGEAPMEVENEKEDTPSWPPAGEPPPPPGAEAWSSWNSAGGQSWGWNNSWNPPSAVPPPPVKAPLLPTPNSMYRGPPESGNDNAIPFGGYNTVPPTTDYTTGYWTGQKEIEIKPHNKRYSKVNVPIKATILTTTAPVPLVPHEESVEPAPTPTLDANKRKQLPAWIREGLEKMERDKQKQLEREKEKIVRDEYTEKIKQDEKEKMEILKSTMKEQHQKSKFESDNENSEDEEESVKHINSTPPLVPLSPEELIMKVRKTMTEILLKVTNQYIEQICKEERQRYIKKIRASDQLASAPSGAILSAKLGLGVYNDDFSSSEESETENEKKDGSDSDIELKQSIKRRMAEFTKTEREIEDRLAEVENRKEHVGSHSTSPESNGLESQVDALQEEKGNQSGSDKSPFQKQRSPSSSSSSSNYITPKSKSRRRSSSSSDSRRKSKKTRDKSRSRSRTPERKRKVSSGSRYSRSPTRKKRSRSKSKSTRRDGSSRRESTESKRKSRRSKSDSPYSRRSRRSRSHSRSSSHNKRSPKRSSFSSRRSRSRSRGKVDKYSSRKTSRISSSRSQRSKRSSSRTRRSSERLKRSSSRSRKSRSERSRSRMSRSSSDGGRGKRSHRR